MCRIIVEVAYLVSSVSTICQLLYSALTPLRRVIINMYSPVVFLHTCVPFDVCKARHNKIISITLMIFRRLAES